MRKINLLYLITKLELGGAQKHLLTLASRLDHSRYNIFLFTAKDGLLMEEAISIVGLKIKRSRFLERPINPVRDALALFEIYRFIKQNNIDIVHTHSSKAGILGRWAAGLARTKVIIHTVHGWSFNDYQSFLAKRFFIALERFGAYLTDKLIVVSCHDKRKGLINRIGREDKYLLIRYGINYAEFFREDSTIREELGIDKRDLVIGMVSCLKAQKSPQDFIRLAFLLKKNPSLKFLLIGDGILRRKLKRLILKFNLEKQVVLAGWRRDIPRILSAIDIFVLTSLWEGLPISVLEAMAASKPVVATNTGGVAEVISDGETGFLVPCADMEAMADKLALLLKDAGLRDRVAGNARSLVGSNFSVEDMARGTFNLYDNLTKIKLSFN